MQYYDVDTDQLVVTTGPNISKSGKGPLPVEWRRRTWKERIFTWPWRPWESKKRVFLDGDNVYDVINIIGDLSLIGRAFSAIGSKDEDEKRDIIEELEQRAEQREI